MAKPVHDGGRPFDWGRTSGDYGKYRDIYPESFFSTIRSLGIGLPGQEVLDLGTGTGVIPRFLAVHGARWVGIDASAEQIAAARELSSGMDLPIEWRVAEAEDTGLPGGRFDGITAVQCWHYFDPDRVPAEVLRLLAPDGSLLIGFMNWLPREDRIAAGTEERVLERNAGWTGAGWTYREPERPSWSEGRFDVVETRHYRERIPFTRESWRGRIRACRGVSASLSPEEAASFDAGMEAWLKEVAPESFDVLHEIMFQLLKPCARQ